MSDLLLQRLRAQREVWVDLGDGLSVCVRRPLEADFPRFTRGITVDHVAEYACNWRGFSEATLLGAGIGSSDPLEFDSLVWGEFVRDNADKVRVVARAMVDAIQQHVEKRTVDAGNSSSSSSSPRAPS